MHRRPNEALYSNPSPEKIEELSWISGVDLEEELSYCVDLIALPPWPREEDHTTDEDGEDHDDYVEIFYTTKHTLGARKLNEPSGLSRIKDVNVE